MRNRFKFIRFEDLCEIVLFVKESLMIKLSSLSFFFRMIFDFIFTFILIRHLYSGRWFVSKLPK